MKLAEQQKAKALRRKGYSIGEIARKLNVSKGSISLWVADIPLNEEQIRTLKHNPHSAVAVEKRRMARLKSERTRREAVSLQGINEIRALNTTELFLLGVALYWGEGSKKKPGVVEFTNSDPRMIEVMMVFLRKACKVPEEKFRGHVILHEHLSVKKAESYWSEISGIPRKQFHKTSVQHNRKRLKKDTMQHGTFAIIVCNTKLKLKMDGWIEGIYNKVTT